MKKGLAFLCPPILLAAAVLLAAGCSRAPGPHPAAEAASALAGDALADYLPPDVGAVYAVDGRRLLDAPAGRRLAGPLAQFLESQKIDHPWLNCLGADPARDVDGARFVFSPPDLNRPLVLLHGRFDPARFAGSGKLHEASDGPFRLYETAGQHDAAHLAPVGDVLAFSYSRPRLLAALRYAAAPRPAPPQDARMRELLAEVDRDQAVWLAVSFDKLGKVPRLNDFGLETVVRPVLRYADGVQGGVRFGDDVRGEFVFRARTEADAVLLEKDIQSACEVAQGAYLLPDVDPSLLPLLRLAGTGTTTRDGRTVTLRCEAPADQLAP
jgi:hypothetical protein